MFPKSDLLTFLRNSKTAQDSDALQPFIRPFTFAHDAVSIALTALVILTTIRVLVYDQISSSCITIISIY